MELDRCRFAICVTRQSRVAAAADVAAAAVAAVEVRLPEQQ